MHKTIETKLVELSAMLDELTDEEYSTTHVELSNATIGQHTRHIIELFQCLEHQYVSGQVCYDNRKRDIEIQTKTMVAKNKIEEIITSLDRPDKQITVTHQFDDGMYTLQSSYHRELLYNVEHCIHHQALIKVALRKGNYNIPESFGVAPSTIRHRNNQ